MDDFSDEERLTWEILRHGLSEYTMVSMNRYSQPEGEVEIFLYIHNEIPALHFTKVMVDGVEVEDVNFVAQYEPDTRYHHIELFKPFSFQATFRW